MSFFKDFVIPDTLDAARAELKRLGADGIPLAGATSLVFMRGGQDKVAVDLSRLGLAGIEAQKGHFRIGSMTPVEDLRQHKAPGWVLDRVAHKFVSQQMRNISTLGGNIVRVFPWSDYPVALMVLDPVLEIAGDATRRLAGDEFFGGQPARHFKPGDLLTHIEVPRLAAGTGFGYRKQTRVYADFSQFTAAVCIAMDGVNIRSIKVAAGGGLPQPVRLKELEQSLAGQSPSEKLFTAAAANAVAALKCKSVAGLTEEYIRHLGGVIVRDALVEAWNEARGERT